MQVTLLGGFISLYCSYETKTYWNIMCDASVPAIHVRRELRRQHDIGSMKLQS